MSVVALALFHGSLARRAAALLRTEYAETHLQPVGGVSALRCQAPESAPAALAGRG